MSDQLKRLEQAHETKFKHDTELDFKIAVRSHRSLALWVADQLALDQIEAEVYATRLLNNFVKTSDSFAFIEKLHDDLSAKGIVYTTHQLGVKLTQLKEEILSTVKAS